MPLTLTPNAVPTCDFNVLAEQALDSAVAFIQNHFNQKDGGVAGQFFSGTMGEQICSTLRGYAQLEHTLKEKVAAAAQATPSEPDDITVREALLTAAGALASAPAGSVGAMAYAWLNEMLEQRGCHVFDPAADTLTDLIGIIIRS